MKHISRRSISLLLAAIMCLSIWGCGKKGANNVEADISEVGNLSDVPKLDVVPEPKYENLLTGVEDLTKEAVGKRPIAVMINNVKDALPQYGIGKADVIFEMPVEGDLTRLMALYADYTQVPDVCSVRSCRYYYPAIAKGFDAFYVHWGMDPSVKDYVASLKMDRYDGTANTAGLFGRDLERKKAGYKTEHTGYFKGTQFASVAAESKVRLDLLESKKGTAFKFSDKGVVTTPIGEACNIVNIKFGAANVKFTYDAEKKLYSKEFNGQAHVDGRTNEQLAFTNVFVLETGISVRDEVGHKKLDWAGSGNSKGYYISDGVVQTIRWSKANGSEDSPLKFYDENGQELVVNRGKSYIAYTYAGKTSWE